MMGRFDGRWLDSTLLAVWGGIAAVLLASLAASLGAPAVVSAQTGVAAFTLGFMLLSAVRVMHWRQRSSATVAAACVLSYAVTWYMVRADMMPAPEIGVAASACVTGFLLSLGAALVPSPAYVWSRIKPVPRPTRPRPREEGRTE